MTDPAFLRRQFLATPFTIRNERRDFHAWRRGRSHYLLWALDVDTPAVRARVAAAQHALTGLLLDGYARQPHVTLALCGFPARSGRPAHDEFDFERIAAQLAALQTANPGGFDIEIGGLESFSSAPFLHVEDDGTALATLRRCLHAEAAHPQGLYVPHVTVGLYADAWPTAAVAQRFEPLADTPRLHCRITHLSLMGYVAAEIGGTLFKVADYGLDDGHLHWHASASALLDHDVALSGHTAARDPGLLHAPRHARTEAT